ncbi:Peroxidase 4 [Linum grandiflorum]
MAGLRALFPICIAVAIFMAAVAQAQLSPTFYKQTCPKALPAIRRIVRQAIQKEARMGASLLRLHFHDCFVNGCDGSVLLDDTANFTGEKTAGANANSIRGFDVIDKIKSELNKVCKGNVVSCSDILAVAARDSVYTLGGSAFFYRIPLGRRDSRTASRTAANNNLPAPFFSFSQLVSSFQSQGLNMKDLVALSGGHTIGQARCTLFRTRVHNDTNIDRKFASSVKRTCPSVTGRGDNNPQTLDQTPSRFDTQYYRALVQSKGLLHSDQELFGTGNRASDALVRLYSNNPSKFAADFGASMIKMGGIKVLTGRRGEVRKNCRRIN